MQFRTPTKESLLTQAVAEPLPSQAITASSTKPPCPTHSSSKLTLVVASGSVNGRLLDGLQLPLGTLLSLATANSRTGCRFYNRQDEGRKAEMVQARQERPQSAPVRRVEAMAVEGSRRRGRPELRWEDRIHEVATLLIDSDYTLP
ncbi:hypothetical protein Tco_0634806 [Tanacetum coccineum]